MDKITDFFKSGADTIVSGLKTGTDKFMNGVKVGTDKVKEFISGQGKEKNKKVGEKLDQIGATKPSALVDAASAISDEAKIDDKIEAITPETELTIWSKIRIFFKLFFFNKQVTRVATTGTATIGAAATDVATTGTATIGAAMTEG